MRTELHWVQGPWPGKLAVAARPRGDDWLGDEIEGWRKAGVDMVLSLLTAEEERDLGLRAEADQVQTRGMKFLSLPIPDRDTPASESELTSVLEQMDAALSAGKNVIVHCRQGIGRSGLVASCLLLSKGLSPKAAVERVVAARGASIPDTPEQRRWIDQYAAIWAGAK
jgi:protein-tyrosine phosphatase